MFTFYSHFDEYFKCSAGCDSGFLAASFGSSPGPVQVRRRGTELGVGVWLPLSDVGPDGGAAGSSSPTMAISQVVGGVESIVEEVQVVSGLGDGEATERTLQLLVVHRWNGDRGVTVRLPLLASSSHPIGPLSCPLLFLRPPSVSGAVTVWSVPTVSLPRWRRGQSNQWPIPHRTWSITLATMRRGRSLLVELGADGLPGGGGRTCGGIIVPVSGGTAGANHLRHIPSLLHLFTWQPSVQDVNTLVSNRHFINRKFWDYQKEVVYEQPDLRSSGR